MVLQERLFIKLFLQNRNLRILLQKIGQLTSITKKTIMNQLDGQMIILVLIQLLIVIFMYLNVNAMPLQDLNGARLMNHICMQNIQKFK